MKVKSKHFHSLKLFLDEKVESYNVPGFIERDPIIIPHQFSNQQDIEIAGLFAAVLAWGQRVTIIKKCGELMQRMDNAPYQFVLQHQERDLKKLVDFKHRTFNGTDTLYFIQFLKHYYRKHSSLEFAFAVRPGEETVEHALIRFHHLFFSIEHPKRTQKHLPTPERKSTCKRLNMYLRWMVRNDNKGVDFGLWKSIPMSHLICPCDLHVDRIGRRLKLIRRKQTDWLTALELTSNLRQFDPKDPVKYDFALFGIGVQER